MPLTRDVNVLYASIPKLPQRGLSRIRQKASAVELEIISRVSQQLLEHVLNLMHRACAHTYIHTYITHHKLINNVNY